LWRKPERETREKKNRTDRERVVLEVWGIEQERQQKFVEIGRGLSEERKL
jgi:hypothetical protein